MPIAGIIKRASNYILGTEVSNQPNYESVYQENEVLFCKNNVCVHPPAMVRQESDILHYPGYLTVTTKTFTDQYNNARRNTLLLTWIPNATLRKCPASMESNHISSIDNTSESTLKGERIHSFSDELKQHNLYNQISDWDKSNRALQTRLPVTISSTNPFLDPSLCESIISTNNESFSAALLSPRFEKVHMNSAKLNSNQTSCNGIQNQYGSDMSIHQDEKDEMSLTTNDMESTMMADQTDEEKQLECELEPLIENDDKHESIVMTNAAKQNVKTLLASQQHNQQYLTSVNITIANPQIHNQDLSPDESVKQSGIWLRKQSATSIKERMSNWMTPEMLAFKHNLGFPDSVTSSSILSQSIPMKCRRFSVDLSQMRSLRLFFNDENCTSGQFVIASRESQYKILHFHHGGLDHLAQVLHQWHCLLHNINLLPGMNFYCIYRVIQGR